MKHLEQTLIAAAQHKGSAFVEILQNCVIFNDKGFGDVSERTRRAEATLRMEEGKPLIFGTDRNKGIRMQGWQPEIVTLDEGGVAEADLLVHNPSTESRTYANILSSLEAPEFPTPIGIFRRVQRATYDELLEQQVEPSEKLPNAAELSQLIAGSETWDVTGQEELS